MTASRREGLLGTVTRATGSAHLERFLPKPADAVWAAWTEPARMARWLAPVQGDPGPGAEFVLLMEPDASAVCTVTRWEPPRLLELIWRFADEGPSTLRLELVEVGGGTRLLLDHERTLDPVDYAAGWHTILDLLVAELSGGQPPDFERRYQELLDAYRAATDNAATDDAATDDEGTGQ